MMELDGRQVLACELELDGRQELVCVLVVDGKELVCVRVLACGLEEGGMEQALVQDGKGLVLLHALRRTHQQYTQHSDQRYTLRFGVYHREVERSSVH
jgi:hypothetical protein